MSPVGQMRLLKLSKNVKKKALFVASALWVSLFPCIADAAQPYLEIKPGFFLFGDSTLRDIYNTGGATIQGEAGVFLNKHVALALNGQYLSKSGRALHSNQKTSITIPTLSLWLKGFLPVNRYFHPYVGVGPRVFFFSNTNHSPYVDHKNTATQWGGGVTIGSFIFVWKKHLYIDPFLDYGFTSKVSGKKGTSSTTHTVSLNGLTAGIGCGYKF